MSEIKTDLFPCNLRAGKRRRQESGDGGKNGPGAFCKNIVISVGAPVEERDPQGERAAGK